MKKGRPIEAAVERPKQDVPVDIVKDLLQAIRSGFYGDSFGPGAEFVRWKKDEKFLKYKVILWPATWLTNRGVTLTPERYKELILEVIQEVKIHGQTERVKYWPGYLMVCIQSRFKNHEDAIYAEAKSLRTQMERVLCSVDGSRMAAIDPIRVLAEARKVLTQARRQKRVQTLAEQLSFL